MSRLKSLPLAFPIARATNEAPTPAQAAKRQAAKAGQSVSTTRSLHPFGGRPPAR